MLSVILLFPLYFCLTIFFTLFFIISFVGVIGFLIFSLVCIVDCVFCGGRNVKINIYRKFRY